MEDKYAVVVTTINHPTRACREIQDRSAELGASFYVIGDTKSPADFSLPGSKYYDMERQLSSGLDFAKACPTGHYARKNVGYLAAIRDGATVLIETDDDNIPLDEFWTPRARSVEAPLIAKKGWNNVYAYFSDKLIWPRGLPLDRILDPAPPLPAIATISDCPVQQGLADANPDVDAIYRLILPLPLNFDASKTVVLGQGVWCPFNSQNTTFYRDAFPLLYLPYHCSFRMTDIWRSFIAQRIMWANNWQLMFHSSTVLQERNEHDLMIDFRDEVPGYLNNERIRKTLEDLEIRSGIDAIPDNLECCYDALIGLGLIGGAERKLLGAFLLDLSKMP